MIWAAFEVTVSVAVFAPVVAGSKCARSVHVCPAVSVVVLVQSPGSPVSRANWLASAPPSATAVSVTGSVPAFVTVDVCAAVAPSSMSRAPKASAAGARDSSVCVPRPVRATVRSGTAADETVTVADLSPVVAGSNSTRSVHVSLAPSVVVAVQSPAWLVSRTNSLVPVSVTALSETGSVPEFVTVDV